MSEGIGNAGQQRLFAFIIDNLFATILGFLAMAVVRPQNSVAGGVIVCVLYLLYFFASEAAWCRTPGKLFTGLKVQMADGRHCSAKAAAIRMLARIIEANPLLFGGIPAGITILSTKRKQRLGDLLAGTLVVSTR
jgi:uncharacterized RDD family membrane protein YckC